MSVLFPAPFSPSRQWICPGSMTRSMWSLATSEPKRLVMPRSSSFTTDLLPRLTPLVRASVRIRDDHRNGLPEASRYARGRERRSALPLPPAGRCSRRQLVFGCAFDLILILPFVMSELTCCSSLLVSEDTFESKLWNGARPVPSFCRVPM